MNALKKIALPWILAGGALAGIMVLTLWTQTGVKTARAQSPTPNAPRAEIGVSGMGRVFVTPDIALASIGVDITAPTLAEATKQASEQMTAVLDALRAQGVAAQDIQTSSYNVYPITNQPKENETPKITGYHVTNIVTIKIRKIANVAQVLDAAIAAGANSVNNVMFTVDNPAKAQDEARALAVHDAMAKAQTLATAARVKVGNVTVISELSGNVQPIFKMRDSFDAEAAGGAGPVEAGQNEITVTVEMRFEITQ
jgi:uncharacterized protein YggE